MCHATGTTVVLTHHIQNKVVAFHVGPIGLAPLITPYAGKEIKSQKMAALIR